MKIKVLFCEFWFKDRNGKAWYKAHFNLDSERTAFVPIGKKLNPGDDITLVIGRDKDGRAKISAKVE